VTLPVLLMLLAGAPEGDCAAITPEAAQALTATLAPFARSDGGCLLVSVETRRTHAVLRFTRVDGGVAEALAIPPSCSGRDSGTGWDLNHQSAFDVACHAQVSGLTEALAQLQPPAPVQPTNSPLGPPDAPSRGRERSSALGIGLIWGALLAAALIGLLRHK
jgi:hypothetical protein